jgi:Flp pilus assembly protein TadG
LSRPLEAVRVRALRAGAPTPRRRILRLDPRGQSLVEFAISLPVVLLMILFGVDFGRVFLGWVTLTNAVREAANFAALNPTAWTAPVNATIVAEYERLISTESAGSNCTLPTPIPDPTFPTGTDVGSPAVVAITCRFSLITPVVGNILGSDIPVSASVAFPIRSGVIAGVPTTSGGGLPSVGPPVSPVPTPIPTPSMAPTPEPVCIVPNLVGQRAVQAAKAWKDAGFTPANLIFQPLIGSGNPKITGQSGLTIGESVPCATSSMTAFN